MIERCIALTFDDGPGPYTDRLLDILDSKNVKATFYMTGQNAVSRPETVERAYLDGHQIGSHSWNHDQLTAMSVSSAVNDTVETNNAIAAITGEQPDTMRPPYGSMNDSLAQELNIPQIMWSVDTLDWKYKDTDNLIATVTTTADRGDIVLMHDIHASTVDAVPAIIDTLTSQGYQLVTVDQLYGNTTPGAGIYYSQPE